MKFKIVFIILIALFSDIVCSKQAIPKEKGVTLANNKLKEMSSDKWLQSYNIDISKLPEPSAAYQGKNLLVDYKDPSQNIWIVIIVHPDSSSEVSITRINDE